MKRMALVGGIHRLEHHYKDEATRAGVRLVVINSFETRMARRIKGADAVTIFAGQVSHKLREVAVKAAESRGVPVFFCHTCGICAFRECLTRCLKNGEKCFLREKVSGCNAGERRDASASGENAVRDDA